MIAERDELSQKAKANENLKKKIQQLTQETKALETLRSDYQIARRDALVTLAGFKALEHHE